MEIPDTLVSLFTAPIDERDGSYLIELPSTEVTHDRVQRETTYRIAILPSSATEATEPTSSDGASKPDQRDPEASHERAVSSPPVEEGETREVTIEDIGDQGDGIARVERGFVIIVPEADRGQTVPIEITHVRDNVAFADVLTLDNDNSAK